MTDIHGVLMGLPSHPKVQVKGPTAFNRPSVRLGVVKRTWREIAAHLVQPGDIVPGIGTVSEVDERPGHQQPLTYIRGGDDNAQVFPRTAPVLVFTART